MTLTDTTVELDVVPLSGSIGAEVRGLDLRDIDAPTVEAIRRTWLERKVVFFPGQQLGPEEHLAFTRTTPRCSRSTTRPPGRSSPATAA